MHYDVSLGLLATDAMTELTRAEARGEYEHYRAFLQKSAEFCRSIIDTYGQLRIDAGDASALALSFLSAVMRRDPQPASTAFKLDNVTQVEPLIRAIIEQNRIPTPEERLRIAQVLYQASAADPN